MPWIHDLLRSPFRSGVMLFLLIMLGLNGLRFISYSAKSNEPLDFRQLYAGAQLLDRGLNPYSDSLLKEQWKSNFAPSQMRGLPDPGGPENYLVYPPPFIASMIPLSRLAWFDARAVVWSVCAVLVLLIGIFASRKKQALPILVTLFILLAFKGTYTAIILGQPLLLSLFFIVLHMNAESRNQSILSGIFLALAFLKPSLVLPFVFFLIAERKFKSLFYTALFSALVLVSILLIPGTPAFGDLISGWFQNMGEQVKVAYDPDHAFLRNNLSSLSSWIYSLSGYDLSKGDTPLLLLFSSVVTYLRRKKRISSLRSLTLFITLSFLFSYHLYYDLLLFLCLLYSVKLTRLPSKVLLPFLILYFPFGFLNEVFTQYFPISNPIPAFSLHPPILLLLVFLVGYRSITRQPGLGGTYAEPEQKS